MAHAPLKTLFFVTTEVMTDLFVQNAEDCLVAFAFRLALILAAMLVVDTLFYFYEIPRIVGKTLSHFFYRQDKIDDTSSNCGVWHARLQWTRAVTTLC